jgi:hypothetical protein
MPAQCSSLVHTHSRSARCTSARRDRLGARALAVVSSRDGFSLFLHLLRWVEVFSATLSSWRRHLKARCTCLVIRVGADGRRGVKSRPKASVRSKTAHRVDASTRPLGGSPHPHLLVTAGARSRLPRKLRNPAIVSPLPCTYCYESTTTLAREVIIDACIHQLSRK